MNVLVTGGAGFIGSHTVVALVEAGFNPIIVDDFSNSEWSALAGIASIIGKKPVIYKENCNNADLLKTIFNAHDIQGVIHFAAFKAVGESMEKPLAYYENNLGSLITLVKVMQELKVPNLIFSSSCTVYGEPDHLPVTEATPVKPATSVYGNTKQIGEEILKDTIGGKAPLKIISLRYFNPIGAHPSSAIGELPRGVPNNLIPFITQTAAGLRKELTIFGNDYDTADGTCVRDYIHVMDLAEAHVAALQYLMDKPTEPLYEVFNVGTGQGATVMELIRTFTEVTGQTLAVNIGSRRAGDVVAVYADASKSNEVLGWKSKRSMEEALRDAWNWQVKILDNQ